MACSSPNSSKGDEDALQLNIPDNFNFETTRGVNFNINAVRVNADRVVVRIYDANPTNGGTRLQQVNVKGGDSYATLLTLPTHMSSVWVEAMDTNGFLQSHEVTVSGTSISMNLERMEADSGSASLSSSLTCNLIDCNVNLSGAGTQVISFGGTVCIQDGDTFTGNIVFDGNGGELRVCGTLDAGDISSVNNPPSIIFYVTDTGQVNGNNFNIDGPIEVTNYGDMNFTGSFNGLDMVFNNHSTVMFGNNAAVRQNSELNNFGVFSVGNRFRHRGLVTNEGTLNVGGDYELLNVGYLLDNFCTLNVDGDMFTDGNNTGTINNNGSIIVAGELSLESSNTLNLGNFSYISSDILNSAGTISGPMLGNFARIDAANSMGSTIASTSEISNRVHVCDLNDMNVMGGATIGASVLGSVCQAYIPPTPCTPEVGMLPVDDEFPGDPFRIYNNFFPAQGEYGTLMFEDLWPSFGDYDMNDLVIAYNVNMITNLQNEVVDIVFDMAIRAIGASFDSGFGIELSISPARVNNVVGSRYTEGQISVLGNGVEAGQNNAVIMLWDNSAYEMGKWVNTIDPAQHVAEDFITVTLTLDPPVAIPDLGPVPFNPFIYINSDRSREVHLPGFEPTTLADPSFFGQEDDTTDPSMDHYYKSITDLHWALNVPVLIPWPREKVSILDAFTKFQSWAESGGTVDADWYLDLPGHWVIPNLYIPPPLTPSGPIGPPPVPGSPSPGP